MTHPRFAGMGGHHGHRAKTEEWLTPPAIIAALGGAESFDLDPCAPVVRPWPTARAHFTIEDNGLLRDWLDGRIWLNPPYGAHRIKRWLARMAEHNRGTALIFARTETDPFHRFVWGAAAAVLFLRGRLTFHLPDGSQATRPDGGPANGGAPSVLCAYGMDDADILAGCAIAGQFIVLRIQRSVVVQALVPTWRNLVADFFADREGAVPLDELYRFVRAHPKARSNRNPEAKARQILQQDERFRSAGRGRWERAQ